MKFELNKEFNLPSQLKPRSHHPPAHSKLIKTIFEKNPHLSLEEAGAQNSWISQRILSKIVPSKTSSELEQAFHCPPRANTSQPYGPCCKYRRLARSQARIDWKPVNTPKQWFCARAQVFIRDVQNSLHPQYTVEFVPTHIHICCTKSMACIGTYNR